VRPFLGERGPACIHSTRFNLLRPFREPPCREPLTTNEDLMPVGMMRSGSCRMMR
jgi:hypothetical protein